ncbi:MAG: HEAT repeat domain-containing protein [Candidatus Brocadiales bacterium]
MVYTRAKALSLVNAAMITLLIFFSCLPFSKADEVDTLIQKLADKEILIRRSAAGNLGDTKDARAIEPLIAALKDEDAVVRKMAAWSLGEIKDGRAVEPLITILMDKSLAVQKMVVWALGEIKDPRATEPLSAALKGKNPFLPLVAAAALGKIKDPRAVEPLIAAMKGNEPNLRSRAAKALEAIGLTPVDLLIVALKDEDPDVQKRAAEALGNIENPLAVEPLTAALKQENLEIVAGAYSFFIRRGETGTEVALINALNKHGTGVMAQNFLGCGNNQLEEAGLNWVTSHGQEAVPLSADGGIPRWGSNK